MNHDAEPERRQPRQDKRILLAGFQLTRIADQQPVTLGGHPGREDEVPIARHLLQRRPAASEIGTKHGGRPRHRQQQIAGRERTQPGVEDVHRAVGGRHQGSGRDERVRGRLGG